jgi:hypothetical protein
MTSYKGSVCCLKKDYDCAKEERDETVSHTNLFQQRERYLHLCLLLGDAVNISSAEQNLPRVHLHDTRVRKEGLKLISGYLVCGQPEARHDDGSAARAEVVVDV